MNIKLQNFKTKAFYMKMRIAIVLSAILTFNPRVAFADTTIGGNTPTVGDDGTVTLKGGDTDLKGGATSLLENGQFIVGVIAGIGALALIGFGIWYGWRTGKQIQEGSAQGWGSAGKVVAGTLIGGGLMAVAALILAIGAATGNTFFG